MKKLVYKKELPEKPGWYWLRGRMLGEATESVVHVRFFGNELAVGNNPILGSPSYMASEWAGPLPSPDPKWIAFRDVPVGSYFESKDGFYYYKSSSTEARPVELRTVHTPYPSMKCRLVGSQ